MREGCFKVAFRGFRSKADGKGHRPPLGGPKWESGASQWPSEASGTKRTERDIDHFGGPKWESGATKGPSEASGAKRTEGDIDHLLGAEGVGGVLPERAEGPECERGASREGERGASREG